MKRPMVILLAGVLIVLTASSAMAARTNLRISPRSINFGGQFADDDPNTATTLPFVVINKNRNDIFIGEWSISGDIADFSINTSITDENMCIGRTLAHRQTCTVYVTFDPGTPGTKSGTLEVRETPFGTSVTAAVSGVAV